MRAPAPSLFHFKALAPAASAASVWRFEERNAKDVGNTIDQNWEILVQCAVPCPNSEKIWKSSRSQIQSTFRHKYSTTRLLSAEWQTGGAAKSALASFWIDLNKVWQSKSWPWDPAESKKVWMYGVTMQIEGSRSLWRKIIRSGGIRSPNPLRRVGWGSWLVVCLLACLLACLFDWFLS